MDINDNEILNEIIAEEVATVIDGESEPNTPLTVTFSGKEVDKLMESTAELAIRVSKDELTRLNSGELKTSDIVARGGMTDAFVEEAVESFIASAQMELDARAKFADDQEKYSKLSNEEKMITPLRKYVWPHEKLMMTAIDKGTINKYMKRNVSYLVNHTVAQVSYIADSLKRNISYNKMLFLDAKRNGFEFNEVDKRSIVTSVIILEELYLQYLNVMKDNEITDDDVWEDCMDITCDKCPIADDCTDN